MKSGTTTALLLAVMAISSDTGSSFQVPQQSRTTETSSLSAVSNRRDWMAGASIAAVASFFLPMSPANADVLVPTTLVVAEEMKSFVDPQGLFALTVPKSFYTLRRTQKGDLPDAKTGKGRRGSSIFTAGNLAKAEVIAVERYVHQHTLPCLCEVLLCVLFGSMVPRNGSHASRALQFFLPLQFSNIRLAGRKWHCRVGRLVHLSKNWKPHGRGQSRDFATGKGCSRIQRSKDVGSSGGFSRRKNAHLSPSDGN
jgi:hypothetical protein